MLVGRFVGGLLSSVVNLSIRDVPCCQPRIGGAQLFFCVGAVHRRLGFALAAFNQIRDNLIRWMGAITLPRDEMRCSDGK